MTDLLREFLIGIAAIAFYAAMFLLIIYGIESATTVIDIVMVKLGG